MNPVLRITLFVSLLLHVLLYLWFTSRITPLFQPVRQKLATQELTLTTIKPPQPAKAIKFVPPEHIEDDPFKANASNGKAEIGSKTKTNKPQSPVADENKAASRKELLASSKSDRKPINKPAQTPSEKFMSSQTMRPLDDGALGESLVKNPLSAQAEEKAKWRNEIYQQIEKQIIEMWVRPKSDSQYSGVLWIELETNGSLKDVWVHLPSGDPKLDSSVLLAVKSVDTFKVPRSLKLNRYYRNLKFYYRGG